MYLFSASAFFSVASANIGLGLMALALFLGKKPFWRDPLLPLSLGYLLYLGWRTLVAVRTEPALAPAHLDEAKALAQTGFFLTLAVSSFLHPRRAPLALGLALAGFFLRMVKYLNLSDLDGFFSGELRAEFGMASPALGLYAGMGLLGVMVFFSRIRLKPFLAMVAVFLAAALVLALLFSQSRAAWLAFAAGAAVSGWMATTRKSLAFLGKAALLAILLLALAWQVPWVRQRTVAEASTWTAIFSVPVAKIPPTSLGRRAHLWHLAWEKFRERPIFGWGPGASKALIQTSGDPALSPTRLANFHNSALDILVTTGLCGLGFWVAFLALVARRARWAKENGLLPRDAWVFLCGAGVMFGLAAMGTHRLGDHLGQFALILLSAAAYPPRISRYSAK